MSAHTTERTYTIRQAAALTGLPSSTLRYYESIGVIAPIGRGESSKHRVYTDADLDMLTWVACLSATGMSVADMRRYLANGSLGAGGRHRSGRAAARTAGQARPRGGAARRPAALRRDQDRLLAGGRGRR